MKIELDENKIYYICHPLLSYGDVKYNRLDEERVSNKIVKYYELKNKDIKILRPFTLLPIGLNEKQSMEKCYKLLDCCDGIILCNSYEKSTGCRKEYFYALDHDIDIISYSELGCE